MKRIIHAVSILASIALLAGCAPSLTSGGVANQKTINQVVEAGKPFGFGSGQVSKDCAVAFDCTANDNFTYMANLTDKNFASDEVLCQKFFDFGYSIGLNQWRRGYGEPEEGGLDQSNSTDGVKACVEALSVNSEDGNVGQSEGVVIYGKSSAKTATINIQVNSVRKPEFAPDSKRGYYFLVQVFEG
jgi:hypothetical protein